MGRPRLYSPISLIGMTRPADPVSATTGTLGPPLMETSTTGRVLVHLHRHGSGPKGGPRYPAGPEVADQSPGPAAGPTGRVESAGAAVATRTDQSGAASASAGTTDSAGPAVTAVARDQPGVAAVPAGLAIPARPAVAAAAEIQPAFPPACPVPVLPSAPLPTSGRPVRIFHGENHSGGEEFTASAATYAPAAVLRACANRE